VPEQTIIQLREAARLAADAAGFTRLMVSAAFQRHLRGDGPGPGEDYIETARRLNALESHMRRLYLEHLRARASEVQQDSDRRAAAAVLALKSAPK
jgi:hypothetical protein